MGTFVLIDTEMKRFHCRGKHQPIRRGRMIPAIPQWATQMKSLAQFPINSHILSHYSDARLLTHAVPLWRKRSQCLHLKMSVNHSFEKHISAKDRNTNVAEMRMGGRETENTLKPKPAQYGDSVHVDTSLKSNWFVRSSRMRTGSD